MQQKTLKKRCYDNLQTKLKTGFKIIGLASFFSVMINTASATVIVPPTALSKETIPEPSNLSEFIANKSEAIALGKALFWDIRTGSDGKTACASCHFHAGADTRVKNQLAPAHDRIGYHVSKPNDELNIGRFPLTKFLDPRNRDSVLLKDERDVVSSQGVINTKFLSVTPGAAQDQRQVVPDPVFHVNGINTRKVEPRNTPTMINAVFNLRNFWDGRAQTVFNGVNPFGKRDAAAGVYKSVLGVPTLTKITLNDSSLASQASGPPLSDFEMSAASRNFPELGKKMYAMRALADQKVASDDSVLSTYRHTSGLGLTKSYADMTKTAFKPEWWNATTPVTINGRQYSQMEANYSLVFSLAIQLYEATLVSGQTPFDRYDEGNTAALNAQQQLGLSLFMSKGKCVNCHGGATFSNAAIKRKNILGQTERLSRMIMGNGAQAVYDEGFYNIGVTRTEDDIGVGAKDPFGNPLSFSRLAQKGLTDFYWKELDYPNVNLTATERVAVDGSFKTPTLRNVTLTAPYFHNGGYATLRSVVEFYNRGGNFAKNNINDLDADIQPLGLTDSEIDAIVAFMGTLTDDRVAKHAGPFDHPELIIPNGHPGYTTSVPNDGTGAAIDNALVIPVAGRNGYSKPFTDFLRIEQTAQSEMVKCANEGGICTIPAGKIATVKYGVEGILNTKTGVTGNIACNNATFGDPVSSVVKACYYAVTGATEIWAQCATYGGICYVTGTQQVRYRNSVKTSNPINATTLTFCLPHMFGLPFTLNDGGVCEVKK